MKKHAYLGVSSSLQTKGKIFENRCVTKGTRQDMEILKRVALGLRKKIGIGEGLTAEQNLWFRLVLGTEEESPFRRNILNFGRG